MKRDFCLKQSQVLRASTELPRDPPRVSFWHAFHYHFTNRIIFLLVVYLFEIYRFTMKIFSHMFHTIGEISTGNARFQAQFQLDLQSFDQNILSFENSLF